MAISLNLLTMIDSYFSEILFLSALTMLDDYNEGWLIQSLFLGKVAFLHLEKKYIDVSPPYFTIHNCNCSCVGLDKVIHTKRMEDPPA